MWNEPTPAQIAKVTPALYETESVKLADKLIVAHFFVGSADWYITEYNEEEDLAFGYANLGDDDNSEWGYIPISELRKVKVQGWCEVDYDAHWTPIKAKDIAKIVHC